MPLSTSSNGGGAKFSTYPGPSTRVSTTRQQNTEFSFTLSDLETTVSDIDESERVFTQTMNDFEEEADDSVSEQFYRRLSDLDQKTKKIAAQIAKKISPDLGSFSEVDAGESANFEIDLTGFTATDVLCLTVLCSPTYMCEEFLSDEADAKLPGRQFDIDSSDDVGDSSSPVGLNIVLSKTLEDSASSKSQTLQRDEYHPKFHNGEYTFALTRNHGMTPGVYLLTVANTSMDSPYSIKVLYNVVEAVRATAINSHEKIYGFVGAEEIVYFRYVINDPKQLVSVLIKPMTDSNSSRGDPDIFLTNKFDGLVGPTKDMHTWKSVNTGNDRVDIHPKDTERGRGNHLVIGVYGYRERNSFELEVITSFPPAVRSIALGESFDIAVERGRYQYFSVDVNGFSRGRAFIYLAEKRSMGSNASSPERAVVPRAGSDTRDQMQKELVTDIDTRFGRGVYCNDSLASLITNIDNLVSPEPKLPINRFPNLPGMAASRSSTPAPSVVDSSTPYIDMSMFRDLPDCYSKSLGIYPVLYLSSSCTYPTSFDYGWRASSLNGVPGLIIETDEWKFGPEKLFFSIFGGSILTDDPSITNGVVRNVLQCRLETWEILDDDAVLDSATARRFAVVKKLYSSIDGFNISQKERSRLFDDNQGLTYGEVDYLPFIQMLQDSGARDGHTFYDLGSGTGRAVISASLSGISFLKCIGIEILPALCDCSRGIVDSVKKAVDVETRNSSYTSKLLDITLPIMNIVEGDVMQENWSEADVIFISSVCFSDDMIDNIFNLAKRMKPKSIIITLKIPQTAFLSTPASASDEGDIETSSDGFFDLFKEKRYKFSSGWTPVFFLRRTEKS